MGSDDGKSIMDVASSGSTKRADENYSHEGRNTTSSNASTPTSPIASTPKPTPGPAGDSLDADLPDGTRVVSTSITVNGQTTVTAQLLDKAGQVLLSAGAGQTMERDSDTGIVQVRTGTSDYVQQFDPATGEVSQALRTGSDAAHVYQNLLDAFSNPQLSAGEGEQLVDASGGLPEASRQAMGGVFSNYLETQGVSQISQAQASAMFNSLMAVNNWDHLSYVGKLSALVNLFNATDKLGDAARDVGEKLPDGLGTAAGYLQLVQGLQSGDNLVIANSINVLSDHALDNAMNQAFGNTAADEAVPYLSYALAIRNFADNPEQAMLTAAGTYFGEAFGFALGGPIGAAIGGALGGMVGGMFGGMFGGNDDIPMREGLAHVQWDQSGHTTIVTTQDAAGGGATAHSWMSSLVEGLQANLDKVLDDNGQPQFGLVPNLLPSVGFKYDPDGDNLANGARGFVYLEWTDEAGQTQTRYYDGAGNRGDGSGETLAGDFMAHARGAIAPLWQVQTTLAHYLQSGEIDLPKQSSSLPHALADGLHQTLQVVSLTLPNTLPLETSPSSNWIDVDGDGYAEQTQWVQANQAMLALDLNGDGQIGLGETVNLQGDNGRTSMAWLDANNDGKLTAQDPSFAALKLWVDVNADGKGASGELQSLSQAGITAIDFSTTPPSIERADGSHQILTVQSLTANTLGVAFLLTDGGVVEATEQRDGTQSSVLHAVNSRQFDDQAAHVHGGGQDLDGSNGAVVQMDVSKLVTTSHNTIANSSTQTSTTVGAGDARLKSFVASVAASVVTNTVANSTATSANSAPISRMAFVPMGQNSAQQEIQVVTGSMIESAQSLLFGGGSASLAVLAAVGTGATASAAHAAQIVQRPIVVSEIRSSEANSASLVAMSPISSNNTFTTTPKEASAEKSTAQVTFQFVDLGTPSVSKTIQISPANASNSVATSATNLTNTEPAKATFVQATVVVNLPVLTALNKFSVAVSSDTAVAASRSQEPVYIAQAPSLGYPVVQAETLPGTEDVLLRLTQSVLLANDSTPNASADPTLPELTITAVSAPLNGQVSLVNGEVLFVPDANFHGTASFTYTVTDQYGLSTNGTALLQIAAVNDAPVTNGESYAAVEDTELLFTQAQLLANDSDVDVVTDEQVLRISRVGDAQHGTVTLDAQGQVRFVPDANYHGPAQFTYWVNDGLAVNGAGAQTPATVKLTIIAVNDTPVVENETIAATEDTPFFIEASTLLANDSDVDTLTDGQVLSLSAVSAIAGQTHGAVSLITQPDGTQRVQFIPDPNYHGVAKFNYTVSDGNGGFATATATVNIAAVNDAPVTQGEDATTLEDTAIVFTQAELLANDSDVDVATDGQVLRISAVSGATNGTVTMLANGDIRFVPTSNYHGPAEFTYTVSDGSVSEGAGAFTNAKVKLAIVAVNDVPVAVGDVFTTAEDITTVFMPQDLLGNDTDNDVATDNDVLSITRVFAPQHCTVTLNADGTVSLTPDANYHGNVRFSYEITDPQGATSIAFVVAGVNAVNDAPVAYADTFRSLEDNIVTLSQADLLGNDSDNDMATDGDVLRVATVRNATNGEVRMLSNGQIEFVPERNFHGTATFDYLVSDSFGATSLTTVTLQVGAVNDLPVVVNEADAAIEDIVYATTAKALLANDSDVDTETDGQVLSITQVQNAQHGVVTMDVNGRITFTPEANFHGTASFEYVVSDGTAAGAGGLRTGTVTLTVQVVNDAPVTQGEDATTLEDTDVVFTQAELLANDTDVDVATDGQVLRISAVSGATNGRVTMLANGDIRFTPNLNYHGPAEFTYTVSDGNGGTADAIVNLTITAVNDAPVVEGETIEAMEDTPFLIEASTLMANDSDVDTLTDGQVLSLSAVSAIAGQTHGAVSLITQPDGTQRVQFIPDLNYHGVAKFNYTVSDGNGGFATATATVNIAAVNDAPVTQDEIATTAEDTAVVFTQAELLANDSDVDVTTDGQVLCISAVSGATNGSVTMLANGDIRFTPNLNYHGPAEFTYTVSDGNGGTANAIVNLTITAVNDAPVVEGETIEATEDTPFFIEASTLLANDSDVDTLTDGQVLSLSAVSAIAGQTHGAVSLIMQLDGTQRVQFIPDLNYHGVAKFNYTVNDGNDGFATATATVNIAAVNDAPVTKDESYSSDEDIGLVFTQAQLLANDTDPDVATDGQVLRISRVGQAEHGTVWLDAQGNLRFVPDANYHGPAKFTYWVSDGDQADGAGAETLATMNLIIASVNDYPVVHGESTNTNEDTRLLIDAATLLANDSDVDVRTDGQVLSISGLSKAIYCTVSLVTETDGKQRIIFVPQANFHGTATFDYTVIDGYGGSATATAVVNLSAVNDLPVTTGETASGDEDNTLVFTSRELLANDTDVDVATDNQVLTISRVGSATHGTVSLDAQGQVRFTPDANYHGPAQFTYWVSDGLAANGAGAEVPATVSLTILSVNDLPVVRGEAVNTDEDKILFFNLANLLANDTDVDVATDGQILSITAVSNATHGTVTFVTQADGSQGIAFTPEANYFGVASYQYTVSDGKSGEATTTVVINLAGVNDAPDVVDDILRTKEDSPLVVTQTTLLANDRDVDNPQSDLRIVGVGNATHGSVYFNPNGSISFVPELDYFGTATFNYTVSDGVGGASMGTVMVNIEPVNDTPFAVGESLVLREDGVATLSSATLLANDTDVDNSHAQLGIQSVGNATHGSVSLVTINGNSSVVFTPELNYNGAASFTYTVSDGVGGTATTSVDLYFTPVNDLPVVNNELFMGKRNVTYRVSSAALLGNDTDVETPNGLSLVSVGNAFHGKVSLVNNNVVFAPETDFAGNASFDYVVQDADGGQSTGTAQINFYNININPVPLDDSFSGFEDQPLSITTAQLLVNDNDTDNAKICLSVTNLAAPTHGKVGFDTQGNVVFTPDANFNGQASFSYQVSDGDGGSSWATVSLNLASVNDAPIIEDIWYGRPIYGYKQLTSFDIDGIHIFYSSFTNATDTMAYLRSGGQLYKSIVNQLIDGEGSTYFVTSYENYSPTYYQNGDVRPIGFDHINETSISSNSEGEYTWALGVDGYRQSGGVVAYDPDGNSGALTFSIDRTPQHGHAWVNQYVSNTAPPQLDHTQLNPYWVNQTGAWQYDSSKGDTYSGSDAFTVRVTDVEGATADATVKATHKSSPIGGGGGGCPVVVDLDGDGVELIAANDSHIFEDVNGDGWRERMGWVSSDDGFLALDRNGDGLIEAMKDISFAHDLPGAQTDLEGLRAHDTNGDGLISVKDSEWAKFGIWRDANTNGIQDLGEFRSLSDLGVENIELSSDGMLREDHGSVVFGETHVNMTNGKVLTAADVLLAGQGVSYPSQVEDALLAQQAEINRKALLFNQVCSTVIADHVSALGFIDTSDPMWQVAIAHEHDSSLNSKSIA